MIHKTQALLLRRQEIRETSLHVIAFTRDLGKIHGLVKGVRGARAAVPWYLEPMTLQSMILYERRRSPMMLISAFDLIDAFDPIRRDFTRMAYASFCLDLVDAMTEVGDPHPEIFELLLATLIALGKGTQPRSMARFLEVRLLKTSGLLPNPESMALSPGGRLAVHQILETSLARLGSFRLSLEVERQLRGMTQGFLREILNRELKSRNFLHAVGLEAVAGLEGPPPVPHDPIAIEG